MEMSPAQIEVQKQHREQQTKYVYYVIALSVAAIAYSVDKTMGAKLSLSQIPLGISIFCWCLSTIYGLKFIETAISILNMDNERYDLERGINPLAGNHPEKIKIGFEAFNKITVGDQNKAAKYGGRQLPLFMIGVVCFLSWHIINLW